MRWSSHEAAWRPAIGVARTEAEKAALRKARVLRQRRYRASVHAER